MLRDFEREIELLGKAFTKKEPTRKIWKFKTGDDEENSDPDDGNLEGRLIKISGMDIKNFVPY